MTDDRNNLGLSYRRRGTSQSPQNRFESTGYEADFGDFEFEPEEVTGKKSLATTFIEDHSKSIITTNSSPDIPFRYSVNPYRGCEHGCSYCYARPSHEFLGMNAGIDFESKVMVKLKAPSLLKAELSKESWKGSFIAMSGITDCYQPAERRFV